jgi:hypothetical protein
MKEEDAWHGSALERPVRGEEETERAAVAEHWERYYALSLRDKLHEDGTLGWLLHTNAGVITFVALQLAVAAALFVLIS